MDDRDHGRSGPPSVSRLGRGGIASYRVTRSSGRYQDRSRFRRKRDPLPVEELIGRLIKQHGLTDEVRQRSVCLYWLEIAGERIASRTFPVSFAEGVLHVSATSSAWLHEMQFYKARLITQINSWVDANRTWLGPPPLVNDMRFVLGSQRREPLVDPSHARQLRQLRRLRPRREPPPLLPSDAECEAIRTETSTIADDALRAVIEGVRLKWNR